MELNVFEGEITNVIDTVEEVIVFCAYIHVISLFIYVYFDHSLMCDRYKYYEIHDYLFKIRTGDYSQIVQQIATVYFYM